MISKFYLSKAQTTGMILSSKLGTNKNQLSGDQSIFIFSLIFKSKLLGITYNETVLDISNVYEL